MGCCTSNTNKSPSPKNNSSFNSNRAPPQSLPLLEIEEETVKEVLSETPSIKPKIPELSQQNNHIHHKKTPIVNPFDVPEIPEICKNLNQRISPPARFIDDRDVSRRVERSPSRNRSPSVSRDLKGQREMGKSPARISEPSPGRVRLTPGRERRGDAGESSGRRTMSPARYTSGDSSRFDLGRSPSMRKSGKSPGRVRSEKNRKVEECKRAPTVNESLENPLVSLECFIFL